MNDNEEDYEVGYGKPPRQHQFKKGDRGNPLGRGYKKGPGAGELFVRLHSERIARADGKTPLSCMRIVIKKLAAAAATGTPDAMEALMDLHAMSRKGGDFKGDGTVVVTDKSGRVLKFLELQERMERRRRR